MGLWEKEERMIRRINELGDSFDQYSYLIVKAQELPRMPEEKRTAAALVRGCQSKVWLHVWTEQDRVRFEADSDTLILRGILQLLRELLDGEPVSEVSSLDVQLFQRTELSVTFTSDRNTGLQSIIKQIQGVQPGS